MKHTISILVENHAGVLSRISGLFSRRGFNIDSLAVGETDDPKISRITIVADGDEHTVEQLEKQLNKLIDTLKVKALAPDELLSRELQLIKIDATPQQRSEILTICEIMGAKIADISATTLTLEISDTTQHLDRFQELIKPYGIKEIVRTGVIAIQKGAETIKK
ncbi:MAG: acetolactate synthase small subunit [Oscillospiraceae bacterium]|nr:acetolactate synthase small subunit [Oscillospiraceae bacterium]